MAVHEIKLDNTCGVTVQLALFRRVENTKDLRNMLVSNKLQCCMVKPSLILDPFHVAVAVNKAIISEKDQRMSTRNIFTEVIYNLSVSKNISQSLSKFGISDEDKDVLVVAINKDDVGNIGDIIPIVVGDLCSIDELKSVRDLSSIKKVYNVKDEELAVSCLLDSVVSRIAAKEFVSFK